MPGRAQVLGLRPLAGRAKRKLQRAHHLAVLRLRRSLLRNTDFSIISNNCWGGFVSQHFGLPYNSPFVGLFLFAPDYVRLLHDLRHYLDRPLIFIEASESRYHAELIAYGTAGTYPIGKLDDVELHFLHYASADEARDKWERRKERINHDNLIVKFCDRDFATADLMQQFDALPFARKVLLTARPVDLDSSIKLRNEDGPFVENEWANFEQTVGPVRFMRKIQGSRSASRTP